MIRMMIHIDRLVLHGVAQADAASLSAGLKSELQRLLVAPDVTRTLAGLGHPACLRAGRVRIGPAQSPSHTGQAIAGAIVRSVRR